MKKNIFTLTLILVGFMFTTAFAQSTTEQFKVYGNCKMCKKTIEKAANGVDGVTLASWNVETKMMEVSYDKQKTSVENIHKAIAQSGYDTEVETAPKENYDKLAPCCQYDRKGEEAKGAKEGKESKSKCTRKKGA